MNILSGNILLNYNQNDPLITLARLCLGFVILFTFPLLVLPARAAMHNLLNLMFSFKSMNIENEEDEEHMGADDMVYSSDSRISLSSVSSNSEDETDNLNNKHIRILQGDDGTHSNNNIKVKSKEDDEDIITNKVQKIQSSNCSPNERNRYLLQQQRANITYNTFNTQSTTSNKLRNKKPKMYNNNNDKKSQSTSSLLGFMKLALFQKSDIDEMSLSSKGTEVKCNLYAFFLIVCADTNIPHPSTYHFMFF